MGSAVQENFTLTDPASGNLAIKVFVFHENTSFDHIQRNNYYSLIWIKGGDGRLRVDFSEYPVAPSRIYSFAPYQAFMFDSASLEGVALQFHPDFFCIHKHHREVACNGILFNNIFDPPFLELDDSSALDFARILSRMSHEIKEQGLGFYESLLSHLRIFLIEASRIRQAQTGKPTGPPPDEPLLMHSLKDAIEKEYRTMHTAGEYAGRLNISGAALAKLSKAWFGKTVTELVSERIIIEAKRELYLTNKTVKSIAWDLGYPDEYYFSRFFKSHSEVSPQMFRQTVGANRGGA